MIREQFNEEFKIFKRFLKEDGTYLLRERYTC